MKRRIFTLLLCLVLTAAMPLTVWAASAVTDNAALFTQEEAAALESKALSLREAYGMDVVILTAASLEGETPQNYAEDFYYWGDYGVGEDYSAIIFLIAMEERELYIATFGDAIFALTDYGIQNTLDGAAPYLSEGQYYAGFDFWLDSLVPYLDAFQAGEPIDGYADSSQGFYHGDREETVYYEEEVTPSILLSLVAGLVAASVSLIVMRSGMNTKRAQRSASSYLVDNSFHLRTQQDMFLFSNVTKTPRPKDPPPGSGGRSGGGSSVHMSSGGRSAGGGGRKF